jgi:glycosyltransferase involved in cell wall biosynthesis
MRVLIDCTQISRVKAGVGVYALNLIREITSAAADSRFWLLVQDDDPEMFYQADNTALIKINAGIFRRLPCRFLMEQFYIPWLCRKHKIDVAHSLHYSFPIPYMRARKVVTVHDMTSFITPEHHLRTKLRYFRFFLRASQRRADYILFVSASTQRDYLRMFPRAHKTYRVTALGKGEQFSADSDSRAVDAVLNKYGIVRPYILFVGTIEPRKNLNRLVQAFAAISQEFPRHSLVIAGKRGWMYDSLFAEVKQKGLETRVLFPGFVDEADKVELLQGADVFVYPSVYEGFGIPVLEALACGTPTITSNVSSMPEVAGDAALLVDPTDADQIKEALLRILRDADLRLQLSAKAIEQARKFDWQTTARETLEGYSETLSRT